MARFLLECVKKAEAILIEKYAPRTYLPIEGLAAYDKAVQELVLVLTAQWFWKNALLQHKQLAVQAH
jgi:aspartate/tyrosine/aromatic aminotransferase